MDPEALFNQVLVDRARLQGHIREALRRQPQVTLADIIQRHPLQVGLAELITYLTMASDHSRANFDDNHQDSIQWTDEDGTYRLARIARVIFTR